MDGILILAFIGGAVTTVNPCGFALLPAYLARRINSKTRNGNAGAVLYAIGVGAVTSSGFMIVFGITGMTISLGSYWIVTYMPWAGFVIGIALIFAGIAVMSGRKIALRLPVPGGQSSAHSWSGDLLFGIGYGTASLSCTLPIFLSVTSTAITGSLTGSAITFIAYGSGIGTVLMGLAIASALARQGLARWMKKVGIYANYCGGGVMVLSGIYVAFYWGIILFLPEVPSAIKLITYGDIIASPLRGWLGGQVGMVSLSSLAILIALFLIWASWARFTRNPSTKKTV